MEANRIAAPTESNTYNNNKCQIEIFLTLSFICSIKLCAPFCIFNARDDEKGNKKCARNTRWNIHVCIFVYANRIKWIFFFEKNKLTQKWIQWCKTMKGKKKPLTKKKNKKIYKDFKKKYIGRAHGVILLNFLDIGCLRMCADVYVCVRLCAFF